MSTKKAPDYIKYIRSDMSDWLVHCLQYHNDHEPDGPFQDLKNVLEQSRLEGSSRWITSGDKCVCFSEAPLTKIKSLIEYNEKFNRKLRYAPFGIAVKKTWLFEKGGRPAIYQSPHEFNELLDSKKYLHVNYNPSDPEAGQDFAWEREWRYKDNGEGLLLEPVETVIFIKNREYLF